MRATSCARHSLPRARVAVSGRASFAASLRIRGSSRCPRRSPSNRAGLRWGVSSRWPEERGRRGRRSRGFGSPPTLDSLGFPPGLDNGGGGEGNSIAVCHNGRTIFRFRRARKRTCGTGDTLGRGVNLQCKIVEPALPEGVSRGEGRIAQLSMAARPPDDAKS